MSRFALDAQPQRELWAGVRGLACVCDQLAGDRLAVDDRVAPLVELDALRQQLGAEAVAGAGDRIDPDAGAHAAALSNSSGKLSVRRHEHAWQGPRRACSSNSAAKTSSALCTNRTAPSGSLQAPRRTASAAQRSTRARPWPSSRPAAISASSPAIAGSALLHGPHWCAL